MASASTLLKLTPFHQWNPTFSYTQRNHHRTSYYRFFSKPQRKPNLLVRLQISCEHKQLNRDAKPDSADQIAVLIKKAVDSLAAVFPNCALAGSGGRIGGSAFSSSSSSSSSTSSSSSFSSSCSCSCSWWSSFSSSLPSLRFFFSSGWTVALFLTLSVVSVLAVVIFLVLSVVIKFLKDRYEDSRTNLKISVVKLQVGLLGSGRTIQQDFDRLAENADTSTKEGLGNVLTEATLDLLRHLDYCISCYSSVDVKHSEEEGENRFNRLSIYERGKFDEETLVNVNSIKRKSSKIQRASGFTNEYIVVTILVAAKGTIQKLQPINGIADLKEALLTLGLIPRSRIMAVEILWTPQDEKESLSERELLQDYPVLKPF